VRGSADDSAQTPERVTGGKASGKLTVWVDAARLPAAQAYAKAPIRT
jgi:hypothetical protein